MRTSAMPVVNSTPKTVVLGPVKDSRWLTLEVCREFARNKCSRPDDDCRFAHPPSNIEIQNGRVMCCFDSIKGRCQRSDPPCKYFHPPQHLKEQLLQNGRNNLIWRNIQMQGLSSTLPQFVPSMFPVATTQPHYLIQPSSCMTNYYNSAVPTTTLELQSPDNPNGSTSTTTIMENGTQRRQSSALTVHDSMEGESAANGTPQSSYLTNSGSQNMYWMNSSVMDSSSLPCVTYYPPVFYQGLNTVSGVVPVVKPHLIPDMRNSSVPVYQCSAPTYPQVALPSVPASQHQASYRLAVPTVNRY